MERILTLRTIAVGHYVDMVFRSINNKRLLKVLNAIWFVAIIKPLCLLILRALVGSWVTILNRACRELLALLETEGKDEIRYVLGHRRGILRAYNTLEKLNQVPTHFLPAYLRKSIKRTGRDCHQILSYISEVAHIDTCIEAWPYEDSLTERKGCLHMLKFIKCFPFEARLTITLSWLFSLLLVILWVSDVIIGMPISGLQGLPLLVGGVICAILPWVFYFSRAQLWLPNYPRSQER